MKKFKMFIASVICLAMFSGMAMAQARGNIGFGFGAAFHKHQNSMLKTAGMNYFRLYLKAEEGVYYFLHNESGSFMVDEGDIDANGQKHAEAIGMSMDLGLFNLDVLVGSATVKIRDAVNGAANINAGAVGLDINSTDPFAELAIRYSYVKNNASLDLNFAYRYHTMKKDIMITDLNGDVDTVNDLSSINLGVGISYMF